MTVRTLSLLLLFVIGFGTSAGLVAALQPLAIRTGVSTPWLIPIAALLCYTATFFVGRRYILPARIAALSSRALVVLVILTAATMAFASGLLWLGQRFIRDVPAVVGLLVWFVTLWSATAALEQANRRQPRLPL